MNILITGASGCIGRALLKAIAKEKFDPSACPGYGRGRAQGSAPRAKQEDATGMPVGLHKITALYNRSKDFIDFLKENTLDRKITAVQCDLTDPASIDAAFGNKAAFKYCVYLASNINVAVSIEQPEFDLALNVTALINFLKKVHIRRLVYMSSTSVYDGLKGDVGPESKLSPIVPYGISKLAAEYYVKSFALKFKTVTQYVILRLAGAYGPYSPAKKIYNRVIKDFYFDGKNEIALFGDGKNLIDLLHVDEVARAVILALKSPKHDYALDLCSGNIMSLNDLIKMAANIFGVKKLNIKHSPFPNTEKYMTYSVSPKLAAKRIGFTNRISYQKGLAQLAEHYKRYDMK